MKTGIHPEAGTITANCTCGAKFEVETTMKAMKVESCSQCHPFYTGKEKATNNSSRVAKFRERQEAAQAA